MRFRKYKKRGNLAFFVILTLIIVVILFLYWLNARLMPTYLQYAEVQTNKVASFVVNKAINARTSSVLDVNDIIENLPSGSSEMITTKFNTEIINRVRAETQALVKEYLQQAENGDLTHLPNLENVEYDVGKMEAGDGIVFFVPLGQAANLPLLGNLGPKIPIRFHIIGNVHSDVQSTIREFGINNAYVEVNIHLEVNVQIIVPFASKSSTVEQYIPVAIGLVQGSVPHIYTNGGEGVQPSLEVPVPYD
ncbi:MULTISPECIES: sporulation protein YunB [Bacillales]|uniref:Sporulation protein YunB n=1 Tax=Lysinibacillus louembei TaxID=1470088 RepID=A0ABZ0RTW5_9BACI|nr:MULTISPECIES: sporulation protein YunB [Bacillales]MCT6925150.1 sporulation protein YunB [Metasolibacillus sp.]MCT6941379.1 sporulation protein YunB [Metasolibacillus sp.]WPK10418.1 sporulation protein YunB [Lysinibacillus louembei]